MNIIFVKWGTKYSSDDVNKLYKSLSQFADNIFYCYTEDSSNINSNINIIDIPSKPALKKWWNKLAMFNKDFPIQGNNMFFDLDLNINSNPFYVLDKVNWDTLTMVSREDKINMLNHSDHHFNVSVNSSVLCWNSNNKKIHEIWNKFINSGLKDYYLRKYVGIDRYIVHEEFEHSTFPFDYIRDEVITHAKR